jgi:ABC-type transport system involved in multi-copper enzyme maturation permease subunit
MISTFSRTRVQALVLALLTWCVAVFVFDLAALACIVSTKSSAAAQQIEFMCDATHVNPAADLHSSYDNVPDQTARTATIPSASSIGWLVLNPVDLFRAVNLPTETGVRVPALLIILATALWLIFCLGASACKLRKTDV